MPWEDGGCTDIDNAVALCRRCHRMLHRRKWQNRIDPDGTYTLVLEDGTIRTTRPPGLDDQLPLLPGATSSEPARVPGGRRPTSRPHCDCRCAEHRSPDEEAEFPACRDASLRCSGMRFAPLEVQNACQNRRACHPVPTVGDTPASSFAGDRNVPKWDASDGSDEGVASVA